MVLAVNLEIIHFLLEVLVLLSIVKSIWLVTRGALCLTVREQAVTTHMTEVVSTVCQEWLHE